MGCTGRQQNATHAFGDRKECHHNQADKRTDHQRQQQQNLIFMLPEVDLRKSALHRTKPYSESPLKKT